MSKSALTAALSGSVGGLATTAGLGIGLLLSLKQPNLVLLSAAVSFLVQAVDSSATWFFVEETEEEIERPPGWQGFGHSLHHTLIQFVSHVLMSLLILSPLLIIDQPVWAIAVTVMALSCLFGLGFAKGRWLSANGWRDGWEGVLVGIPVIGAGLIAGLVLA